MKGHERHFTPYGNAVPQALCHSLISRFVTSSFVVSFRERFLNQKEGKEKERKGEKGGGIGGKQIMHYFYLSTFHRLSCLSVCESTRIEPQREYLKYRSSFQVSFCVGERRLCSALLCSLCQYQGQKHLLLVFRKALFLWALSIPNIRFSQCVP